MLQNLWLDFYLDYSASIQISEPVNSVPLQYLLTNCNTSYELTQRAQSVTWDFRSRVVIFRRNNLNNPPTPGPAPEGYCRLHFDATEVPCEAFPSGQALLRS